MFFAPALIALSAAAMTASDDQVASYAQAPSDSFTSQQQHLDLWFLANLVLVLILSLKLVVDLALFAHSSSSRLPIPSALRHHWFFVTAFSLPVIAGFFALLPSDVSRYLAQSFPAAASLLSFICNGIMDTEHIVYCFDKYGNLSRLLDATLQARFFRCHEVSNLFQSEKTMPPDYQLTCDYNSISSRLLCLTRYFINDVVGSSAFRRLLSSTSTTTTITSSIRSTWSQVMIFAVIASLMFMVYKLYAANTHLNEALEMCEEASRIEANVIRTQRDFYEDLAERIASDNAALVDSLSLATKDSIRVRSLLRTVKEQRATISSLRSSAHHHTSITRSQHEAILTLSAHNEVLETTVAQLRAEISNLSDSSSEVSHYVDEAAYEEFLNFASFQCSILTDLSSSSSVYPSSSASDSLSASLSVSHCGQLEEPEEHSLMGSNAADPQYVIDSIDPANISHCEASINVDSVSSMSLCSTSPLNNTFGCPFLDTSSSPDSTSTPATSATEDSSPLSSPSYTSPAFPAPPRMERLFEDVFGDESFIDALLPRSVFASIPIPESPTSMDMDCFSPSPSVDIRQYGVFTSPLPAASKVATPVCVFKGKVKSSISDSARKFLAGKENVPSY